MPTKASSDLKFGYLLNDVARLLRRDFEKRVSGVGLTLTQWRAIAYLVRQEGINQSALAELLDVTPITLTRLIDRMEEAGWLERRRDPLDRRATCLYLTDKVQPVLDEMAIHSEATHKLAFSDLSKTAELEVMKTLSTIKQNLLSQDAAIKEQK